MPRFAVQRRYFAVDNGQPIGPFAEGTEVELEQDRAEWINRDSPGCLEPVVEPEPAKSRRGKAKEDAP